jgi:three-Cys-motif partner protein
VTAEQAGAAAHASQERSSGRVGQIAPSEKKKNEVRKWTAKRRACTPVSTQKQQFGGDWTADKLERVRKYLVAYAKIMRGQHFRFAYIDAFAGTGYNTRRAKHETAASLFPELAEGEAAEFIDGSARIALKVEPRFTKYIFIEKDATRFEELGKLKDEFPALASDIVLVNADANAYLRDVCENRKWARNRAVLFLDPFGMQVTWETMKAIAKTKAIDLWILFPLGIGVNRLLRRDAKIPEAWQRRLDDFFGTAEWQTAFYETKTVEDLFGDQATTKKVANFNSIGAFFVERLETIFQVWRRTHSPSTTVQTLPFIYSALQRPTSEARKPLSRLLKTY